MHAASTIIYAHAGGPLCAYRQPSSPCGRRAIINGNGVEADNDAARRVATSSEERGESVLNRRIPKGEPRRKARMGSIFYGLCGPSPSCG